MQHILDSSDQIFLVACNFKKLDYILTNAEDVCSKKSDWRNQTALEFFDRSSKISLLEIDNQKREWHVLSICYSSLYLHSLKKVAVKETRWLWNSLRIPLLSAPLTKFRPEKLTNALSFYRVQNFCDGQNFLSKTKSLIAFGASSKTGTKIEFTQ